MHNAFHNAGLGKAHFRRKTADHAKVDYELRAVFGYEELRARCGGYFARAAFENIHRVIVAVQPLYVEAGLAHVGKLITVAGKHGPYFYRDQHAYRLFCFFHIKTLVLLTDDVGMIGHKGKDCQARRGNMAKKI